MAVDPNVTLFLDLVTNNEAFRATMRNRDRDQILAAFSDNGLDLSEEDFNAFYARWSALSPDVLQALSNIQESLGGHPHGLFGN
jgi:hypothetical protein